jgi:pimeloyl-ACP methyl ester carboxylesterase
VKIVLLHAFPLDEGMWKPQREALAGRDVLAPNLYERGESIEEWAASILDELDGELAAVGASMGGYCALALARLAPERVRGLLLTGSRPDGDSPERREGRAATIELIRNEGAEGLWRDMRPRLLGPDPDMEAVTLAHEIAAVQDEEDLVRAVEAIRDRPDSTEAVTRLQVPLLVLAGELDELIPAEIGQKLAAATALGRFHLVEGAAHLPNLERPDEVDRALGEFLQSL